MVRRNLFVVVVLLSLILLGSIHIMDSGYF